MTENSASLPVSWDDDLAEWTDDQFDRAEFAVAGSVIRPATGSLTGAGGRPRSANPKRQVTLRLDPDVIERFRATGKGWQSRINAELRKALGI